MAHLSNGLLNREQNPGKAPECEGCIYNASEHVWTTDRFLDYLDRTGGRGQEGQTHEHTHKRTTRTHARTNACTHARSNEPSNEQTNEQTNARTHG